MGLPHNQSSGWIYLVTFSASRRSSNRHDFCFFFFALTGIITCILKLLRERVLFILRSGTQFAQENGKLTRLCCKVETGERTIARILRHFAEEC